MKECIRCGAVHDRKRSKYCSTACGKIVTKETRLKLSEIRKRYLRENKDKHPWKRKNKFKSVPCEFLKKFLNDNGIKFVEEWQPLEDRFFSIDIAFPDIKFGIEVNGNQHYESDGNLKEYYKIRHDLIESSGWKLIELHYSSCYNMNLIKDLVDLREQPDYSEFFKIQSEKKLNKSKSLPKGEKSRLKSDLKWNEYKILVLESGIKFDKHGWVVQVSKILKISQQKVNPWMKRYLPDFYEEKCFKRKLRSC